MHLLFFYTLEIDIWRIVNGSLHLCSQTWAIIQESMTYRKTKICQNIFPTNVLAYPSQMRKAVMTTLGTSSI